MAMKDTEDMDMDVNAVMLMLNQKLMLIMAMEDTADTVVMDMVANADLLKLLQLHITDMADMVDTDMAVNDDLLSPIMDMEATEDMDMDMDVKLILLNSEEKQLNPIPKVLSNEETSCTSNNSFISK